MYKDFLVYKSGLYQVLDGAMKFNSGHAIKIIGWDVLNGKNHWIIENSFGESWGINGLGYIAVGEKDLLIEEYTLAPMPVPKAKEAS